MSRQLVFEVRLDRASSASVSAAFATTNGTAASPADFAFADGTINFPAGATTREIRVAIADDSLYEGEEGLAVVISNATNASIGRSIGVGRILDNETPPVLQVQDVSVVEGAAGGSQMVFDLALSAVSAVEASLRYATRARSATEAEDYRSTEGLAVFAPGEMTASVTVAVFDDALDEFDEHFDLEFSLASELVLASAAVAGTIVDDDPLPVLAIADASLHESGGILTFNVRLSQPSGRPVTANFASANSSALSGGDYAAVTGTLSFQPGEIERSIDVPVLGDVLYEGQESFLVTLSSVAHAVLGQATAVGTILDDDLPPTDPPAQVTVTDVAVTEGGPGNAEARFSVQLSEALSDDASVDYATIAGTATESVDFIGVAGILTFPAGTTTAPIVVDVAGDTLDEPDETFRLVLGNLGGNIVLADSTADATIVDDDTEPTLSISDSSATEGNAGATGVLSLTVGLSAPSGRTVSVNYATSAGSAEAGSDFQAVTGSLTFNPGETSQVITVPISGDSAHEGDETFNVALSAPEFAAIADGLATATIHNDDGPPEVSLGTAQVVEGSAGTATMRFTVELSDASALDVTVGFSTSNGTASAGLDYTATSGTLAIPAGVASAVIDVTVVGDALDEDDETLQVHLANAQNATIVSGIGSGTIVDDDSPPSLSITDASLGEAGAGGAGLQFEVSLSAVSGRAVTVDYASNAGTALPGSDFVAVSGTLSFAPGETTKLVAVAVLDDAVDESDEALQVVIGNPLNATLADGAGTGTITDDDQPPSLNITDASINEGDSGSQVLAFTVSLSSPSGLPVSVDFATGGGTAAVGIDYAAAVGTLAFPAGESSGVVEVSISGDLLDEVNESFDVTLASPINAGLSDGIASGTIVDNDAEPALSISDASATEGNAGDTAVLSLTISLSTPSGKSVSVDYATSAGSAEAGSDFQAVTGSLTFNPGEISQVIAVPISADSALETDETFEVVLSNPEFATIADGLATATILNDDGPPAISIGEGQILEGDTGAATMSFTVELSQASELAVTVDFATGDGTAVAGLDYTSTSGTLVIPAGATSAFIDVAVVGDVVDEIDEGFSVDLVNATNADLSDSVGEGMIIDDDAAPSLSITDASINEGDAGAQVLEFTVSLNSPSGLLVRVDFATGGGTAAVGADYAATSGTLALPVGETSAVVGVAIAGDILDEPNETFNVTLTNPINADLSDGVASGTIVDDDAAPSISITSVSGDEGMAGGAELSFAVNLSTASGRTVTVGHSTVGGTALAGTDFTAASGTLSFAPGDTTELLDVAIASDPLDEEDETLQVHLSNPQNASISGGIGTGTIVDDDAPPTLSISDASVSETDSGTSSLTFALGLSAASGKAIGVGYATQDGTAAAGEDYTPGSGTLAFDPGATLLSIVVQIEGDVLEEGDETLFVNLSNGSNVTITDAQATGTIIDDDDPLTWGLDSRPTNLTCVAPARPVLDATISLSDAFPNLVFANPLAMVQPPGDDSRWFLIEQAGRVLSFENDPGVTMGEMSVAIDIVAAVEEDFEKGLLGLAFHPDYGTAGSAHAGELFLSYTASGSRSRISRFTTTDNWGSWAEEPILEINRVFPNHNGGNIAFGPDGFLYAGFGDGGGGGDPMESGQDTRRLLGKMLRLDVDDDTPYGIPPGNPFAGNPLCPANNSSVTPCPEIFAWGLRNPWRWSFDSATGALWLGDVGQDRWEEINLIEVGGNYGWDVQEGNECFEPSTGCDTTGLIPPIAQYGRDLGVSVAGGFVYRGSAIPELVGRYLFADTYSGNVWMLEDDGQGGYTQVELLDTNHSIASFAEGHDRELYVLTLAPGNGRILKVVPGGGGGGVDTIPTLLSDTGCFDPADPTVPASGLIPYTINAPFWSDGAEKERYIAIPDNTTIAVGTDDDWTLPPGTVIAKNFTTNDRLIETRLLMRHPDGVWAGYTYEWDDNEIDATRVVGGKTKLIDGQPWIFPSEGQCDSCHTVAAGFALGLESAQLNRDFTYVATGRTANQLTTLDHIALFSAPLPDVPEGHPRLADPADTVASLDSRARAYLHTNCAQCHRPLGPAPSAMDLRYQALLSATNTCDVLPLHGSFGVDNARLIAPGDSSRSILLNRMSRRDVHGMPPLASSLVDIAGATLLAEWIEGLASCN